MIQVRLRSLIALATVATIALLASSVGCSSDESSATAATAQDGGASEPQDGSTVTNPGADGGVALSDGAVGTLDGASPSDAAVGYGVKSMPGLVLWLESETGVTFSGASPRWEDQSGGGNHALPVLGMSLPDRNASTKNGHQALGFHETECLEIPDAPSLQWGTGDFFVGAVTENNWNRPMWDGGSVFTYQEGRFVRKRYGEVYSKIASLFGPGPTLAYNDWTDQSWKIIGSVDVAHMLRAPRTPYGDPPRVLGLRRKGNVLELRVDGAVVSTLADAGAPVDVSAMGTKVAIGGRKGLTNFVGSIWEIVAAKGTVADSDVAAFEAYAKSKYGL